MAGKPRAQTGAPAGAVTTATADATDARRVPGQAHRDAVRPSAAPAIAEQVNGTRPLHDLRFGLLEQISYHAARELFLARLGRFLTGAQVFLGTTAVGMIADILPGSGLYTVVAAALTGVLLLVLDPFAAAREHRILRARFHELLAECEERECGAEELRSLRGRKERIMASAPPAYRAVQAIAYNLAVNATYDEADAARYRYDVGFWRRLFANWFAMRGMAFKRKQ